MVRAKSPLLNNSMQCRTVQADCEKGAHFGGSCRTTFLCFLGEIGQPGSLGVKQFALCSPTFSLPPKHGSWWDALVSRAGFTGFKWCGSTTPGPSKPQMGGVQNSSNNTQSVQNLTQRRPPKTCSSTQIAPYGVP